ncbi:single-stranded DNA-binding protein [bacterium]|nr:single-stranded DNA-binding protein [bacterium]
MVNKVILIGNLGRDPELTYTQGGTAVCKVSLATTERFSSDGEKKERTEWHNLVFWRRQAEIANEYLRKGSRIYVEGRISYRQWEDRDGNKRYGTDIVVQNMQMLSSRSSEGGGGYSGGSGGGGSSSASRPRPERSESQSSHPAQDNKEDDGRRYEPIQNNDEDVPDNFDKDDLPF